MLRKSLSAALFVTVAASTLPATSFAGVMPIADNATVSVLAPTTQVDWRAYPHRHHRWHMGWYYGWPRSRLGAAYGYAAPVATYGYAAPAATYGATYPWYGAYGAAYPSYANQDLRGLLFVLGGLAGPAALLFAP